MENGNYSAIQLQFFVAERDMIVTEIQKILVNDLVNKNYLYNPSKAKQQLTPEGYAAFQQWYKRYRTNLKKIYGICRYNMQMSRPESARMRFVPMNKVKQVYNQIINKKALKDVALFFKQYRKDHNLTQKELGAILSISQRTVSRIENASCNICINDLNRYINMLGEELEIKVK
ncbi:MAG: helix-turn-helix domain-containing protein [Candidatus Micrarchaeaceae archaeon]